MSRSRSIIESKLATSFQVGQLYVPANSLSCALSSYVQPALFYDHAQENELGKYGLSVSGTAFKIKHRNRFFCLISAHQRKLSNAIYQHDELCIHSGAGCRLLTSHRAIFPEKDDELDFDATLYEFTEVVSDGRLPDSSWYPLSDDEIDGSNPMPLRALAAGFPGHLNSLDYSAEEMSIQPYCVFG